MLQVSLAFLPEQLVLASVFIIGLLVAVLVWNCSSLVPLFPKSLKSTSSNLWLVLVGVFIICLGIVVIPLQLAPMSIPVGSVIWSGGILRYFAQLACVRRKEKWLYLLPYVSVLFLAGYVNAYLALVAAILLIGSAVVFIVINPEQGIERKALLNQLFLGYMVCLVPLAACGFQNAFILPALVLFLASNIYIGTLLRRLQRIDSLEIKEVGAKNEILKQDNERIFEANEKLSSKNTALSDEHKELMQAYDELVASNAKAEAELLEQTRASNILDHLRQSVDYARRIQNGIFYSEKEICEAFPEAFVFQKPRDVVSGDFVWFSRLNEYEVILAAIDCTGHGVPGAFMTIMGNNLIHTIVNQQGVTRPDQILFLLDRRIRETLSRQGGEKVNDGMDLALCKINFKKGEILFSGARNPLCVVDDGEVTLYKGTRRSIGGSHRKPVKGNESPYELHTVKVQKSQSFYIYSDGFQDQLGGLNRSKYMARRFRNFLKWNQAQSMEQQKTALEREQKTWQHKEMQTDDILVIGFRVTR